MLQQKTQIIIADEHPATLTTVDDALRNQSAVEIQQGVYSDEALFEKLEVAPCDLLIYGLTHGETLSYGSLTPIEQLARAYPQTKIIVLAREADPVIVTRLLAAGCVGFVNTNTSLGDLPQAIEEGMAGHRYVDSATTKRLIQHMFLGSPKQQMPGNMLTPRETEVVEFFAKGMTVNEIALHTQRSIKTIHTQKQSAMRKLGVCTGAQLIDAFKYIQVN